MTLRIIRKLLKFQLASIWHCTPKIFTGFAAFRRWTSFVVDRGTLGTMLGSWWLLSTGSGWFSDRHLDAPLGLTPRQCCLWVGLICTLDLVFHEGHDWYLPTRVHVVDNTKGPQQTAKIASSYQHDRPHHQVLLSLWTHPWRTIS